MEIAVSALIVLIATNVFVTVSLWRSQFYSRGRRLAQLALIWVVPVLGSALVWYILREGSATRRATAGFVDEISIAEGGADHHSSGAEGGAGH